MSNTKKVSSKDFIFNSYKRDKKTKAISTAIDAAFGLLLASLCIFLMSMSAYAQNVGINNPTPHTKSLLDLTSSDKGLLAPRMTEVQRTAMFSVPDATAKGMLVYQTDNVQGFYFYDGAVWQTVTSGNAGWGLTGNTGTNVASNFIGTTDNKDLVFKANNIEALRIKPNSKLNISSNNATPSYPYSRVFIADEDGYNSDLNMRVAQSSYPQLVLDQSGGSLAAPTPSAVGNWSGVLVGRSYDGGAYRNTGAVLFGVDSAVAPGLVRGNIQFQTSGGTQAEKMRITKNGNVGIGITNPSTKLYVVNNDSAFATSLVRNTHAAGWSGTWYTSTTGALQGHFGFGNSAAPRWANRVYAGSITAVPFVLTTTDLERMRIEADGDIGIGTTTPLARLHVFSNSTPGMQNIKAWEQGNDFARMGFYNDSTTKFWEITAQPNSVDSLARFNIYNSSTLNLMTILGNGRVGIGNTNPIAPLSFNNSLGDKVTFWNNATTSYGIGIQSSLMQVHTSNINDDVAFGYGNSAAFTETMRVKGNGDVGIGTSTPTATLEVNGYTKLGSDAPAVKMRKYTGNAGAANSFVNFAHGLNQSKILSVTVMVQSTSGDYYPPNCSTSSGANFYFSVTSTQIYIFNIAGNSANIANRPYKVLVTYEE